MKFYKLFLGSIILCNISFAGLFDNEVKIKFEYCENKDGLLIYTYTADKEKNKVFEKREIFLNKKLLKTELNQLENCIILNKNNWKCGGQKNYFTDQRNGKLKASVDTLHQVIDGKYYRDEHHYEFDGKRENLFDICYKITQY